MNQEETGAAYFNKIFERDIFCVALFSVQHFFLCSMTSCALFFRFSVMNIFSRRHPTLPVEGKLLGRLRPFQNEQRNFREHILSLNSI